MIGNLIDKEGLDVLRNNYIGYIGFISQGSPYVIPVTYFFDEKSGYILSYSAEGHKINAMRKNKLVSVAVTDIETVTKWRSVLLHGEFEELSGIDAKYYLHRFSEGVKKVITRKEDKHLQFVQEFSSKLESEGIPIVYRIKIVEMTAKYRENHQG